MKGICTLRHLIRRNLEFNLFGTMETVGQASSINLQYFDFAQAARISIQEIGDDFQSSFGAMEEAARDRGAVIFQAWITMAPPGPV